MSTKVWESIVIKASMTDTWDCVKSLDFGKLMPGLVNYSAVVGGSSAKVGGLRKVCFKDGSVWTVKVLELSEIQHRITWELVECTPASKASSRIDTLSLSRVTLTGDTFVVWDTDFSSDATLEVTQDCKFKKIDSLNRLAVWLSSSIPEKMFALLDRDGNGKADPSEVTTTFKDVGLSADQIKMFMISADVNMDEDISWEEFDNVIKKAVDLGLLPPLEAILEQMHVASDRLARTTDHIFNILDLDNDNVVTLDEMKTIFGKVGLAAGDGMVELLKGSDLSKDGKVTRKEFVKTLNVALAKDLLPPLDAILAQLEVVMTQSDTVTGKIFTILDEDSSGALSAAEVKDIFKKVGLDEDMVTMFMVNADINMDEDISRAEFDTLLSKALALDMLPPLDAILAQLETLAK